MQADSPFWIAVIVLALGVAGVVLAPLMRAKARPERRASYDMQVYRDQLREIDADVARGVLSEDEAAAVRVEISRRLLGAADAETVEAAADAAPRGLSRVAAIGVAIALVAAAGGLYAALGAPGRPDAPLGARLAAIAAQRANRPSQAEVEAIAAAGRPAAPAGSEAPSEAPGPAAESPPPDAEAAAATDLALIERLRGVLASRPDDVEGHRLLARAEASLGNWPEARAAQQRLVELLGPAAQPEDRVDLAEFMIVAANGYVSPEAETNLTRALEAAPENPVARYYSGLALVQNGRPDLAFQLWTRLLSEGPPDAPWIPLIAAQIDEVAMLAGKSAPAGPSRDDVAAAEAMTEADRAEMIAGMVSQLSDRLAAEGGPPEDWAQLIRSLGVLGRTGEAEAIFREARDTFAADPAALALLRDAAKAAGVAE